MSESNHYYCNIYDVEFISIVRRKIKTLESLTWPENYPDSER